MFMLQQAKWFGFSLALHLIVAASLIPHVSRNANRTPNTITVVLDNRVLPALPQKKPAVATNRTPAPPIRRETASPELSRQTVRPAAPAVVPAAEKSLARDVPKLSPDVPAVADNHPRTDPVNPAPGPVVKTPVHHSAPAAQERSTPEKVQQRYLKEHFAYISSLITKQLAYPPIARKMRWSGKVTVAFVIAEDGSVSNIRIIETSGFTVLDKSATETVRNVAPYPKPPVRAEIVVPINFKLMP
jgi:protein TonB